MEGVCRRSLADIRSHARRHPQTPKRVLMNRNREYGYSFFFPSVIVYGREHDILHRIPKNFLKPCLLTKTIASLLRR